MGISGIDRRAAAGGIVTGLASYLLTQRIKTYAVVRFGGIALASAVVYRSLSPAPQGAAPARTQGLRVGTGADIQVVDDWIELPEAKLSRLMGQNPFLKALVEGPMSGVINWPPEIVRDVLRMELGEKLHPRGMRIPLPMLNEVASQIPAASDSINQAVESSMETLEQRLKFAHQIGAQTALDHLGELYIQSEVIDQESIGAWLALAQQYDIDTIKRHCFNLLCQHLDWTIPETAPVTMNRLELWPLFADCVPPCDRGNVGKLAKAQHAIASRAREIAASWQLIVNLMTLKGFKHVHALPSDELRVDARESMVQLAAGHARVLCSSALARDVRASSPLADSGALCLVIVGNRDRRWIALQSREAEARQLLILDNKPSDFPDLTLLGKWDCNLCPFSII